MNTPLEDIKARVDLAQYIGQYVKLSPSGKSLRGLCPFHKEKTPSFFVSPERQVWYCFGCQKGGDVFRFVMEYEKLEFPEALKLLADRAGITVHREDPRIQSLRNRIIEVLAQAQEFYRGSLERAPEILRYLATRGMEQKTMQEFGIGLAPHGWQNLLGHLRAKGFTPQEIEQAGLIIRRQSEERQGRGVQQGYYDRFRSRVMFPIFDHMGRVVGFSGRIVPPEFGGPQDQSQEAKYINTPDTLVYQKGKVLYGFHKTKDAVKDMDFAVLVEGNMDMLMGWQAGIANIVAVSGTGLTEDQLRMLKRLCANVVLNFDMDRAGEMATDRSIGLALKAGFSVKILSLPDGKDMADFVKTHPGAAKELVEHAKESMEYYFQNAFGSLDATPGAMEDKKRAVTYLLPRIKMVSSAMDRHVWVEKLAHKVGLPERVIEDELRRTQELLDIAESSDEDTTGQRVEHLFMKSRIDALAERALGLCLKAPESMPELAQTIDYFPFRLREFVRMLVAIPVEELAAGKFPEAIDQESINYLVLRADYELAFLSEDADVHKELSLTLRLLRLESVRARLRETTLALKEAEAGKYQDRIDECARQLYALTRQLGELEAAESKAEAVY